MSPLKLAFILLLGLHSSMPGESKKNEPIFQYDPLQNTGQEQRIKGSNNYDVDILIHDTIKWITWLEFTPEKGDQLILSKWKGEQCLNKAKIFNPGRYCNPTLTRTRSGQLILSYEFQQDSSSPWGVWCCALGDNLKPSEPFLLSQPKASCINHEIASHKDNLHFVWQEDKNGSFEIEHCLFQLVDKKRTRTTLSENTWGDWQPSIAVNHTGVALVVWDAYDGSSYNIHIKRFNQKWHKTLTIKRSDHFQARADVVADRTGNFYVAWEEGNVQWGKDYKGRNWNNFTDTKGTLHQYRELQLLGLSSSGQWHQFEPFPMPAYHQSNNKKDKRPGLEKSGIFYERPKLIIDGYNRPWLFFRHFINQQMTRTEPIKHHVESGFQVMARYLHAKGWSHSFGSKSYQRDGMQRLSLTSDSNSVSAIWTTGRSDRRHDPQTKGLVFAQYSGGNEDAPLFNHPVEVGQVSNNPSLKKHGALPDDTHKLFFGDLHRHTDLSLCFNFLDGSIEDAYRYGIDAAELDFMGITDHSRDLAKGNHKSQLWWRTIKEVTRHRLHKTFIPYYAYERSTLNTDHNIISLSDDKLRPHQSELPEFWKQIANDTFTIPHQTIAGKVWQWHDDQKRPLLEIYQGGRDNNTETVTQAHLGLNKNYHFGFIASSDHISTHTSYACVWAPEKERESIFRSMQARRTYAATDKIKLIFKCGKNWMGESIKSSKKQSFYFEVQGTAPIQKINVIENGKITQNISLEQKSKTFETIITPVSSEQYYMYIHVVQSDGNQAWSSPIWIYPDTSVSVKNKK